MKKIISLLLAALVLVTVAFVFAACGKDEVKDDITSMMDDATTLMDEVSTGLDDLGDDLTQEGNVTDESEENTTAQGASEDSEGLLGGEEDTQTTLAE